MQNGQAAQSGCKHAAHFLHLVRLLLGVEVEFALLRGGFTLAFTSLAIL